MTNLNEYRLQVDRVLDRYRNLVAAIHQEKQELKSSVAEQQATQEAIDVAQKIAQLIQQTAHQKIARIVTRCLAAVFDHPYEFQIRFERKRGRTEAYLVFVRDGQEIQPKAVGGGVINVAAFALRLACLVLSRPQGRLLLVCDEPFHFLHSVKYQERVSSLLMTLATEMGVQIILVTGEENFQVGKVVEIG